MMIWESECAMDKNISDMTFDEIEDYIYVFGVDDIIESLPEVYYSNQLKMEI